MAIEEQVRARLRQARFERGLSLADVGARAGMTASAVSRLETGARRLTLAQVERLAEALEVSTDALLAGVPTPARDGRVWSAVGAERTSGPRVYRIAVPVQAPELHQHEGHQWLHVLSGVVRLVVGASDRVLREGETAEFSTWEPHSLGAVGAAAEVLVVFRPAA
jgi:transcriptional regulator with XRE-family HTH domain